MATHRPQPWVNMGTSGEYNYTEYCAPPGIYKNDSVNGIFPEKNTSNLCRSAPEYKFTEDPGSHMYKMTSEGDYENKAPFNIYQAIQGVVLNPHTSLTSTLDTLEIGKYAKRYSPPNLCILTPKGDNIFSEDHTPSTVYIGALDGDKIFEYRATQNVYKITPEELKDNQYPLQKQFENLIISEYPKSTTEYTKMPERTGDSHSKSIEDNNEVYPSNISSEEVDVFTFSALIPWEETKKGKEGTKTKDCSTDTKKADMNANCKCEENYLCRCENILRGKYYDYYEWMKEKEYYTMYPKARGKRVLPKGTILHFTGAPDNMMREDLQKALEILGAIVEFVDFQKGNNYGWVRLSFSYEARIIIKKMNDKKLKINDSELVFRVLSGKEEKRYLKNVIDNIYKIQKEKLNQLLRKRGYKYVKNIN